jgi:hypothetical protein
MDIHGLSEQPLKIQWTSMDLPCIALLGMRKISKTGPLYQGISRRPLGIKIRDWYQN